MNALFKLAIGAVAAFLGYKVYQAIAKPTQPTQPIQPPAPLPGTKVGYWLDGATDGALTSDAKYVDAHGRVWTYGVMGPATMNNGTSVFSIVGLTSRSQIAAKADASV